MKQVASRFWFVINTVLCLGLNLLIRDNQTLRRWKYLLWTIILINEARGLYVVYLVMKKAGGFPLPAF